MPAQPVVRTVEALPPCTYARGEFLLGLGAPLEGLIARQLGEEKILLAARLACWK